MRTLYKVLCEADHTQQFTRRELKLAWRDFRLSVGLKGTPNLLSVGDNVKVNLSVIPTWLLTLSPHRSSLEVNACVHSTSECRQVCVMEHGRALFPAVIAGRRSRTVFAAQHATEFLALLGMEVQDLENMGTPFGLRLNAASDLPWEFIQPELFAGPNVRGYDYTKYPPEQRKELPNYRLTYSKSERLSDANVVSLLNRGHNVAIVFDCKKHELPPTWYGFPVIDGDLSDYRYSDPKGCIIGLAAKGKAKKIPAGGFIVSSETRL